MTPRHPLLILALSLGLTTACGPKQPARSAADPAEGNRTATEVEPFGNSPIGTADFERATVRDLAQLARIHFDFDRYEIRSDQVPVLETNAQLLRKFPRAEIVIEGHCDERGSVEYNLALGERRARATREYLIRLGVDPDRLSIVSYGKESPLDRAASESAWARNRRAEFVAVE